MSRVLRITHWPHPTMPTMVCLLEADMKVSAEQAVEELLCSGHGFFTYEIFDSGGGDMASISLEALGRTKAVEDAERNMAIAYQWYAMALARVVPGGTVASTQPPPYSREQAAWVLQSLAQTPVYDNQTIIIPLADGTQITLKEGEVK